MADIGCSVADMLWVTSRISACRVGPARQADIRGGPLNVRETSVSDSDIPWRSLMDSCVLTDIRHHIRGGLLRYGCSSDTPWLIHPEGAELEFPLKLHSSTIRFPAKTNGSYSVAF